jgi:hypothetical protein
MATYWSKNPIYIPVTPDITGPSRILLTINVEDRHMYGAYRLACELVLFSQNGEDVVFKIDSVLDAILEESKLKDAFSTTDEFVRATYTCRRFQIFSKRIGTETTINLGTYTVILGGVVHHLFYGTLPNEYWFNLHSRPSVLKVKRGVPLYLSAYITTHPAFTEVGFLFQKIDSIGGSRLVRKYVTELTTDTNIFHLLINEWPLADEKPQFSVYLQAGSSFIDPFGTNCQFEVEEDDSPINRIFLFRNTKGGWETFTTSGILTEQLEVDRQILETGVQRFYPQGVLGTKNIWQTEASVKIKVSTGWLPDAEYARWLAWELMLSTEVYELKNDGDRKPIILNTKSLTTYQDENYLNAIAFEYSYSFPILAINPQP